MGWETRIASLRAELQAISDDPPEEDEDSDTELRGKAWCKLTALYDFFESDPELQGSLFEVQRLILALIDIHEGRGVAWLKPKYDPTNLRISVEEANLRSRYAAVADYLFTAGGKTEDEAAKFVAQHGKVERLTSKFRSNQARAWEMVKHWRQNPSDPAAFERERSRLNMRKNGGSPVAVARDCLNQLNATYQKIQKSN